MSMMPLRYKISSWRQLPQCKSNNDRDLSISITDYYNNEKLRGFRILVKHVDYGTVFACVLEARGSLITEEDEYGKSELSTECILSELRKFGFYITYVPEEKLPGNQVTYLMTLNNLGYDKIRILQVWDSTVGEQEWKPKVVAFQSSIHGDWLNNAYAPSVKEFTSALDNGTAINLTFISNTRFYRWDWLKGKVCNIDDIIKDNANDMIRFDPPEDDDEDGEDEG